VRWPPVVGESSYSLRGGRGDLRAEPIETRKARAKATVTRIRGGGGAPAESIEAGQSPVLGNGKMGKEEDGEDLRCTWASGELTRRMGGEERCRRALPKQREMGSGLGATKRGGGGGSSRAPYGSMGTRPVANDREGGGGAVQWQQWHERW
jgi:hypothetical protein